MGAVRTDFVLFMKIVFSSFYLFACALFGPDVHSQQVSYGCMRKGGKTCPLSYSNLFHCSMCETLLEQFIDFKLRI